METKSFLLPNRRAQAFVLALTVLVLAPHPAQARKAASSAKTTATPPSPPTHSDTLGYDFAATFGKDAGKIRVDFAPGEDSVAVANGTIWLAQDRYRFSGKFERKQALLKGDATRLLQYGEEAKGKLAIAFSNHLDSFSGRWDSSEIGGTPIAGRLATKIVHRSIPHRDTSAFIEFPFLIGPEDAKFNGSIAANLPREVSEMDSARFSIDFVSPELLVLYSVRDYFREHGEKVGTIIPKYPETAYEQFIFDARKPGRIRTWTPMELVKTDSVCRQLVDSVIAVKRSERHYFVRALEDHLEFGIRGRMEPFAESIYAVPVSVDCRPQTLLRSLP